MDCVLLKLKTRCQIEGAIIDTEFSMDLEKGIS